MGGGKVPAPLFLQGDKWPQHGFLCCVLVWRGVWQPQHHARCHFRHQWRLLHPQPHCLHAAGKDCFLILLVTGPYPQVCHFPYSNCHLPLGCIFARVPPTLCQGGTGRPFPGSVSQFCRKEAANFGKPFKESFLNSQRRAL